MIKKKFIEPGYFEHLIYLPMKLYVKIKLNENQELIINGFEVQVENQRKKYFTIVDKNSQLER